MVKAICEICRHDHAVDQDNRKLEACSRPGCRCGNRRALRMGDVIDP